LLWGTVAGEAVVSLAFYLLEVVPPSRTFSYDLTHRLKRLALYLRDHSSPDAVVAAADIGYLAYFSDRRVLDLGGLVEPETGKLRRRADYEEILERGLYLHVPGYPHVDFLVDRVKVPRRFDGRVVDGFRLRAVRVEEVDNLGIRKPGPFYYTLYRIEPVQE
jgi:hypothetical protein